MTTKVVVGLPVVVEKVRVDVADPPDGRVTFLGLKLQVGQLGHRGGAELERLTVPLNPLMLVTTIMEVAVEPCCTFWEAGLADMEKSGVGACTTLNETVTEWDRLPLVPVTVTLKIMAGVLEDVVKVSVAWAVPPEATNTLLGLMLQDGHPIARHIAGSEKLTVPEKPFRLATVMADFAEEPCWTV